MNVILFFAGFALAVVIGTKCKVNAGFIALIIGTLINWIYLKGAANDYIKLFPVTLFWNYAMPIIFYAFATANGTLKVLGKKIVYLFRNAKWALAISISITAFILGAAGASSNNTFIVAPLAWGFALTAGLDPLLTVSALWCGTMMGSYLPWTTMGALHVGFSQQYLGVDITWKYSIWLFIMGVVVLAIMYVIKKGWKVGESVSTMEKPESFSKDQVITLYAIFICILLLLVPSIVNQVHKCAWATWCTKNLTIPVTTSMGIGVLALFKVGDLKEVFKNNVNWNILFTIVFMSQYCGLATKMGVSDTLVDWLSNVPPVAIGPIMCLIGAALSFCTSASTVLPLLYAMVVPLAGVTGLTVTQMAIPMLMGVGTTSISPISTGGAACQIGSTPEISEKLFVPQMILAVCIALGCTVLSFVGFFYILG